MAQVTNKRPAKDAKEQQLEVMTAQIGKQLANYLVPNYNDGQTLAIVDEGVLKYLTDLLPKANPYEIISNLIGKLERERSYSCKLENAVKICKDFTAFHETVNLLNRYFDPNVKVERSEPFNQAPRELTITEKIEHRNALAEELARLDAEIEKEMKKNEEPTIVGPTIMEKGGPREL